MAVHAQAMARELALGLLGQQWQPRHLSPSKIHSQELLIQHCVNEAVALREANQAGLSLELLLAAEQMGLQSPWLLDSQARALEGLGRRQAAWELWEQLVDHSDPAVAADARAMVERLERDLVDGLLAICAQHGWTPRHLTDPSEGSVLERVLKELGATREMDAAQLSLDLADGTLNQGWENPWLHDDRARALVLLKREPEALEIWRELQNHPHAPLAETATAMAGKLEQRVARQQLQEHYEQLVRDGQQDNARQLLLHALMEDPQSQEWRLELGKLLRPEPGDLLSQELEQHEAALAVHDLLVEALETRLNERQLQH